MRTATRERPHTHLKTAVVLTLVVALGGLVTPQATNAEPEPRAAGATSATNAIPALPNAAPDGAIQPVSPDAGSVEFDGKATEGASGRSAADAAASVSAESVSDAPPFATFSRTDYVSAGVGGLRNIGSGQIDLAGVTGQVKSAYLFWQGPTNSIDSGANANIQFNGNPITGTNIGFSDDNCWGFANSQAYRANVTPFVTGDGAYQLTGLLNNATGANINGASLIVFFDDGNPDNDLRVSVFNGNDSNIDNEFDAAGWNVRLGLIGYAQGPASLELHVSDGQDFSDDAVRLNGTEIVPAGQVFDGNTTPGGPGPTGNGSLWDIRRFDITSLLSPGTNELQMTTGSVSDCLSAVVAIVAVDPDGVAPTNWVLRLLDELFGNFGFFGFSDDPVNTATGNFTQSANDLEVPASVYGMDWVRSYNSLDDRVTGLGRGWVAAHDPRVLGTDSDGVVTVELGDGRRIRFGPTGFGTFTRPVE